jgi:hypothetical protein
MVAHGVRIGHVGPTFGRLALRCAAHMEGAGHMHDAGWVWGARCGEWDHSPLP